MNLPTFTTALALLLWIRKSKQALQDYLLFVPPGDQQDLYRGFINSLFRFERQFRGCQQWLREESAHKRPSGFGNQVQYQLLDVFEQALEALAVISPKLKVSLEGSVSALDSAFCERILTRHLIQKKLPALARELGIKIDLDQTGLRLEFAKDGASKFLTLTYSPPYGTATNIWAQLDELRSFTNKTIAAVKQEARRQSNWPTYDDVLAQEKASARDIAARMMRSLSAKEKALLKQYPQLLTSALFAA